MRCLFCKKDTSTTKSIEHIIPESLGNSTLVLPLGFVCDKCNNYFAREVEKPFLEQFIMRLLRFQEAVPNKKKKIPSVTGILDSTPVTVHKDIIKGEIAIGVDVPQDLFNKIKEKRGEIQLLVPKLNDSDLPNQDIISSRFIAKIALEAMAERLKESNGGLDFLIDYQPFDLIRNHARMGTTKTWPCNIRRIYSHDARWQFKDSNIGCGQVKYECDFLFPKANEKVFSRQEAVEDELYFVVALWGIEFTINMFEPEIAGYRYWLKQHNYISPLHYGKNQEIGRLIDD